MKGQDQLTMAAKYNCGQNTTVGLWNSKLTTKGRATWRWIDKFGINWINVDQSQRKPDHCVLGHVQDAQNWTRRVLKDKAFQSSSAHIWFKQMIDEYIIFHIWIILNHCLWPLRCLGSTILCVTCLIQFAFHSLSMSQCTFCVFPSGSCAAFSRSELGASLNYDTWLIHDDTWRWVGLVVHPLLNYCSLYR